MRILLIILLSINTCFGQQTWASLSSNQGVSWGALTDAINTHVFQVKNTLPTNGLYRLIERDSIAYYVYLDTTNAGFAARANNQMIQQSDLTAAALYSITVYDSAHYKGDGKGWYTSTAACANYGSGTTNTLTYSGTLGAGTVINCCWNGGNAYVYYSGHWYQILQDGTSLTYYIGSTGTCSGVSYYTYNLSTGTNGANACANVSGTVTYYSSSSSLANGVYLFSNTGLTSYATGPIYISDGSNSWYVAGGAIGLQSQAVCSN